MVGGYCIMLKTDLEINKVKKDSKDNNRESIKYNSPQTTIKK